MIGAICDYLNNYFVARDSDRHFGSFTISGGVITSDTEGAIIENNRYYRIIGSSFNDGVHASADTLTDESFSGAVWIMALPPDFLAKATEIGLWQAQYGAADSAAMSPYNSESFNGYSYTKSAGSAGSSGSVSYPTWQTVFGPQLSRWRKI